LAWGNVLPIDCEYCHHQNRLSAAFCGGCGRGFALTLECAECATPNPRGQRYCNECGVPLTGRAPLQRATAPPTQSVPYVSRSRAAVATPSRPAARPRTRADLALWGGVAAALTVAVFARTYLLANVSAEQLDADLAFAQAASRVSEQGWIGLRPEITMGQPAGLAYALALWTSVFGDTVVGVRLLATVLGLASLALFHLLCRRMFGQRPALIGSLLLAFSVWHLYYSRLALPVIFLLTLELLALHLVLRAFAERPDSERQRWLLVLAGLSFGATAYVHNAFFIFAVAMLLIWAWEYMDSERRARDVLGSAAVFFLTALIVAMPYLVALAGDADRAGDHVHQVALTSTPEYMEREGVSEQASYVLANIGRTAAAVLLRRDVGAFQGGETAKLLDPVTALLALIGLAAGLWRLGKRGHAYVWILFVAGIVAAGLTSEAGMFGRLIVILPAVFGAAGFGLHWLLTWLKGRMSDAVAYGLVALLLAFVAFHNLNSFFDETGGMAASLGAVTGEPASAGDGRAK